MSEQPVICTLGYHAVDGARHWVIRQGLEEAGFTFHECTTQKPGLVRKYWHLKRQCLTQPKPDFLMVPFQGHYIMPLAFYIACKRNVPIVFDAFISLYDSMVEDRELIPKWHPRALEQTVVDWLSCRLADVVLIDTEEHKQYFVERYRIPPEQMLVVPIGCRTDVFQPQSNAVQDDSSFKILFHGSFIPLQGIDTILRAAKIVQAQDSAVHFEIIGKGQTYDAMRSLADELQLTNTEFTGFVPMEQLPERIAQADACLGIFGTTAKTSRVIPHKAYEIIACAKPLITGDTTAARNHFEDGHHVLMSKPGDPEDLAQKILQLKEDSELRQKIAANGRQLFREKWQPREIVRPLEKWLIEKK